MANEPMDDAEETLLISDRAHRDEVNGDAEEMDEDDSEDDEDFDPDDELEEDDDLGEAEADIGAQSSPTSSTSSSPRKRKRSVSFNKVVEVESHEQQTLTGSSDEESEDDEDSSSDESSSEGSSSEDSSDDSEAETEDELENEKAKKQKLQPLAPSSLKRKESKAQEVETEEKQTQPPVPPGEGTADTQRRNRRRQQKKKLNNLISKGVLGPDATFADLRERQIEPQTKLNDLIEAGTLPAGASLAGLEKWENALNEEWQAIVDDNKSSEFKQSRDALLEAIKSGGIDVEKPLQINAAASPIKEVTESQLPTKVNKREASLEQPEEQPQKRSRLDLAGSRRLVFGSLGVRVPKTKDDEEKLRAKLADTGKPKIVGSPAKVTSEAAANTEGTTEESNMPLDPDAWKGKIRLSAVECVDEAVELSQPPFPFQQCWDPQYAWNRPTKRSKKKKKSRAIYGRDVAEFADDVAAEEDYPSSIDVDGKSSSYLNYDDTPVEDQNGILAQETVTNDNEGFPPLPGGLSALPSLRRDSCKAGMYVAFKKLEVSAATKWAPEISAYRVALIQPLDKDASHLQIKLAPSHREHKDAFQRDENGKRLAEKFEAPIDSDDEEDEEEDDGIREVAFEELLDAKVLDVGNANTHDSEEKHAEGNTASSIATNNGKKLAPSTSRPEELNGVNEVADEDSDGEWDGIGEEQDDESDSSLSSVPEEPPTLKVSERNTNGVGSKASHVEAST